MLKITAENEQHGALLKLEGKLSGPWVAEAEHVWKEMRERVVPEVMTVDISGVTYVDHEGTSLLGEMCRGGAGFRTSILTRHIVEKIYRESESSRKG